MGIDLWGFLNESTGSEIDCFPAGIQSYLARQLSAAVVLPVLPDDTRKHLRIPMNQCALAVRLNEADQPNGQLFEIYVKDVSAGGLGFMHTLAFTGERLAIKLTGMSGDVIVMVGRVVRCVCRQRAYEVGVEFTSRISKSLTPTNSAGVPSTKVAVAEEPMDGPVDPVEAIETVTLESESAPEKVAAEN